MCVCVQEITSSISFTPIGLLDMYNSGGAVDQFDVQLSSNERIVHSNGEVLTEQRNLLSNTESPTVIIKLKVRGCGRFGAYSSQRPSICTVDGADTNFEYDSETGLLTITLPVSQEELYRWPVQIQV